MAVKTIVPCKECHEYPCTCDDDNDWWTCPHCGSKDCWFDRSIIEYQDESGEWVQEGPWTRCSDCGKADDDPIEPDQN